MAELPDTVGRMMMAANEEPPSRFLHAPSTGSPPDKFVHTPEHVRAWLQGMRVDELAELQEAMKFFGRLPPETKDWIKKLDEKDVKEIQGAVEFARSARTLGRFGRMFLVTIIGAFIGAVAFGEKIAVAWNWVRGAR